jgi:hypothetical protein
VLELDQPNTRIAQASDEAANPPELRRIVVQHEHLKIAL